ncbi:unnamed protein product [Brassica rapa subsp. narinosa]
MCYLVVLLQGKQMMLDRLKNMSQVFDYALVLFIIIICYASFVVYLQTLYETSL